MATRAILTILLALGLAPTATAQWRWQKIAWDGATVWSVVSPPDSGGVLYASVYPYSSNGVLERGVHKSMDGGRTWRFLAESWSHFANRLSVNRQNQGEIYCGSWSTSDSPETWPQRSRDAGEHWERISRPLTMIVPSPWRSGLLMGTQATWWPYGEYHLYRSLDDGLQWELLCTSAWLWAPVMCEEIVFHREDSLVVIAPYITPGSHLPGLGRSLDGGLTWQVAVPGEVEGFDQDPRDPGHWIALMYEGPSPCDPGFFAETFDNWDTYTTWDRPESLLKVGHLAFDLGEPNVLYMVEHGSQPWHQGVLRSGDAGRSWERINEGFDDPGGVFRVATTSFGVLAATRDGLWQWRDAARGDQPMVSAAQALWLEAVWPCPFRRSVSARFMLGRPGLVEAGVYDLRGGLVALLGVSHLPAGIHAVSWDGRNGGDDEVPPGTYVLVISGDTNTVGGILVRRE